MERLYGFPKGDRNVGESVFRAFKEGLKFLVFVFMDCSFDDVSQVAVFAPEAFAVPIS